MNLSPAPRVLAAVPSFDPRTRPAARHVARGLAALAIGACGGTGETAPAPRGLELTVAPLTLAGIGVACYDVRVWNGSQVVWSKGDPAHNLLGQDQALPAGDATTNPLDPLSADDDTLCSDDFGNRGGGSILYIGPCDAMADANTTTPEVENAVTLWVDGLYDAGKTADIGDWQDPCASGCTLEFDCVENRDTQVEFNLTILRRARQGFFDVAVNFEDVFCSAKLDCVPELLFRPDGGPRDLTAVLGFACSSGASQTCLYANGVTLDCGGSNVWTIDPSLGPGNIAETSPLLFAAATYSGDEAYTDFDKSYWNIGLGLDETKFAQYPDCTLRWTTTASEAPLDDNATPLGTTYPFIAWERKIIDGGQLDCGAHALNEILDGETEAAVATEYTEVDEPETFAHTNCAPAERTEPSCTCPADYVPNLDGTVCTRTRQLEATSPTTTLGVCQGNGNSAYSMFGANFAADWTPSSFEITESGSNPCAGSPNPELCVNEPEDAGWTDYLTHVGVWTCPVGTSEPIGQWIGFSQCLELAAAGDYLIGIAGDNRVRLRIDGADVYSSVSSLNFRAWNVSRVSLSAGTHIVELFGLNDGAVAAFGAEIYGPFAPGTVTTPTQMAAALNPSEEGFADHVVFSTRDLRGTDAQFDSSLNGGTGYTCPDGYALSLCSLPALCVDIDEVACQR